MVKQHYIAINQLGYRPNDHKLAVIQGQQGKYRLVDNKTDEVVWVGESSAAQHDEASGATVCKLDFTSFNREGQYRIEGDDGSSWPFLISPHVYEDAQVAVLKAFYFLRCGVELTSPYAGPWAHAACHNSLVHLHGRPEVTFDGTGGWHDAGDYGKYIVAAGKAVADLLLAYELYPQAFKRKVPLPESNNVMDDLLHEVKVELDWMFKMQDAATGGVYHKLTTLQFPPIDTMPEADTAALYAMPISACATASFAASMAMAARVYAPYDERYASSCLHAAQYAWQWLEANPQVEGFRNPPDVGTGEYGDLQDEDERYWAAAELYRTTGDPSYHDAFLRYASISSINKTALGWTDMGGYGTISYLLCNHKRAETVVSELKQTLSAHAEQLADICTRDGYSISMLPEQYRWGSNMDVMNQAMLLIMAQYFEGHQRYEAAIAAHVHYLLGMNVNGISYISGYGHAAMTYPHHRTSIGDGVEAPVPGMVSGGPNKNLQDDYAAKHLQNRAPAACYADHEESYATNEITIYWNSPALFVLSHVT